MRPLCVILGMAAVMAVTLIAQHTDYWVTNSDSEFRAASQILEARQGSGTCIVGGKIVIWGGVTSMGGTAGYRNNGAVYDPILNNWEFRPNLANGVGAPPPRSTAAMVAINSMIVFFGGMDGPARLSLNTGGAYDLATDTWLNKPILGSGTGSPNRRHSASLARAEDGLLIVWGGQELVEGVVPGVPFGIWQPRGVYDGGVYSPSSDSWLSVPALNAPVAHPQFCAGGAWVGDGLIGRGGLGGSYNLISASDTTPWNGALAAGGRFDITTMEWRNTPNLRMWDGSRRRGFHGTVWTGEHYMEFGGVNTTPNGEVYLNDGLVYDPDTDAFLARPNLTSANNAPAVRMEPTTIWTGAHMLIWGGYAPSTLAPYTIHFDNGGLYYPVTDTWTTTPALSTLPSRDLSRIGCRPVFDGSRVYIWGGQHKEVDTLTGNTISIQFLNTGAIYVPPRVAPSVQSPVPVGNTASSWSQGGTPSGGAVVQVGQYWRHRITAYGCPVPDVAFTGLAPWMSVKKLDTGAFIQGTPTANDAYTAAFITVYADNGIGQFATQTFTISVTNVLAQIAFKNQPGTTAYASVPYTYAALNNGPVPTGLTITCKLSGSSTIPAVPNTPNWPQWLSWNGITLTGTPPGSEVGKSYDLQILGTHGQVYGYLRWTLDIELPTAVSFAAADVNDDQAVDVVDVQLVVNWLLALVPVPGPTTAVPMAGDVNGDASRDVVDVQAVVNRILNP